MFTYQASIGRNTKAGEPMRKSEWIRFVNSVSDAMGTLFPAGSGNAKPEIHYGTGVWNGVSEDSAIVTVRLDSAANVTRLRELHGWLAADAHNHGQDAIGFLIGESILIPPTKW